MAFCPSCGSPAEGRFCQKCGAAMPAGGAAPAAGPAYSSGPQAQAGGMQDNLAAALCYLVGVITGILFLVLEPYNRNRNIRFHAFQSIFFWIAAMVSWVVLLIVGVILHLIPIIGSIISLLLWLGLSVGVLVVWLMLMYKAYNNEKWLLPVIGPLAEKQA
ncbi:MAG: hypothetical protein JSU00_18130 [Acidobacteria bacterium]|nr:hypothetical protein [Acidobacteriota bacterium]